MTIVENPLVEDLASLNLDDLSIHQRMVAIMAELPAIGKSQRNEQQKFMYRGHDDVMNALNPLLAKWAVFVLPTVLDRQTSERTTQRGTTMYEVNLLVSYKFYGAKGDSVTASAWGEGTDSGDKSTNKAMTMAFKNVLAQAFAISTAELSDTDGASPEETTRRGRTAPEHTPPAAENTPFDPSIDLLEGAITGPGYADRMSAAMEQLSPTIDWAAVIKQAWPTQRTAEFWRRLSNCLRWIEQAAGVDKGDFPPVEDEKIIAGFAWAFDGVVVEIVEKPAGDAALTPEQQEKLKGASDESTT